jgi:sarcosine oxidase, subunit gamma
MPDLAAEERRVQPLAGRVLRMPDQLEISPAPPAARFSLRCKFEDADRLGAIFGVPLPVTACRARLEGARAALWLGPDEWLLLAEDGSQPAIQDTLTQAPVGLSFSLVDVSQQFIGILLNGSATTEILSSGCPLDLDETAFAAGSCTRTVFGKCGIVLWRTAAQAFRVEVLRSYAEYAWGLLGVACRGGAGIGGTGTA